LIGFPVKIPILFKRLFPNYVWGFSSKDKTIYLTFDDGPTAEITLWILNLLKQYNAKATFFCIGENIEKHPKVFNTILNEGHTIGNHTQNHINGWRTGTKTYLENTEKAQKTITSTIAKNNTVTQKLFRPPYGKIRPSQAKSLILLDYKIIMWSVVTYDWEENLSKEKCFKNAINKTKPGEIIVFHDSLKASENMKYALPKTLEYFSKKGYEFKAI
jgi:peptidoglycan/xylan/chitin deacetylase (PgdA/CDA1 family)